MAEPWIRVHANIAEKRVIIRASDQLRVSTNEAIGLLVRFWGAMSRLGQDGQVSGLTDREIEQWAGWRGRRGAFASFIREQHTDAEGRVNEWDEYQGALEHRRATDRDRQQRRRERLRESRRGHAGGHAERPRDGRDSSAPARAVRNETKRDTTQSISQSAREAVDAVAVFDELAAVLETPAARDRLRTIADSASSPGACLTALRAMATGNDPAVPKPTPTQLGVALIDFAGNGERWNAAHFRGYVRRAIAGAAPEPAADATQNGRSRDRPRAADRRFAGDRNDAVLDAWARDGEAEVTLELPELDPEPEPEEVHHGE